MAKKIDTVTVEVVRNLLMSIAEETYGIIVRSAYSTNMKERRDVCTAVIDPDGNSVAQVESLAALLGSMLSVVPGIYEKFGRENVKPGDMFIANDPYHGGGNHLPAERRVQQQLTARAAAGDLGRRAAHIDVEHIKPDALFPDKEYRLFQCFRLCAEKLDGIQAVGMLILQKLQRFAVAEVQRLGACHLADGPGRAVVRHQMAARRIGQPRHRCKNRTCGDL